jgi:hypothetical protein
MRTIIGLGLLGVVASFAIGCGPSARQSDVDADPHDIPCGDGAKICTGNTLEVCVDGEYVIDMECPTACSPQLGCVECVPGTGTCNGEIAHECRADGSGYQDVYCDPVQGMSCGPAGVCEGACAPLTLGNTYYGCDYYPTVTGNAVGNNFNFAVAISNTSGVIANVTIDGGGLTVPITLAVQPGDVATQTLPWIHELKLCSGPTSSDCLTPQVFGANIVDGSYHLRTTAPVTVYQFNPLEYTNGSDFSYSNDASLLLPTNAWTGNYIAATWARFDANAPDTWPGLMAITAAQDGTQVTITTTATTNAAPSVPVFQPGVPQTVTLNAGDVLEIASFGTYGSPLPDNLTGSVVNADKPVQVIAGHYCTYIPDLSTGACDHIEESMFPIETLSNRYIVTAPAVRNIPAGKRQIVRIVATEANTTLTYDPPQAGGPAAIAAASQYVDLPMGSADYLLTASHKVLVMQFMEGQDPISNTGDPGMALAVPVEQYRTNYLFHAPTNYETNFVNVTAPMAATIQLDGTPVTGFTPIGTSGYGIARVQLGNGVGGNHNISGDQPFGISVTGYGQWTSYWYPGGLDLSTIVIE